MARTPGKTGPYRKPRADVYTVLLLVALIAMIVSCVVLYVEVLDYGENPLGAAPASTRTPQSPATGLAWGGAGVIMLSVYKLWRVRPSLATLLRTGIVSGLAYAVADFWPAPGFLLFLKLPVIGIFIALAFLLLGEFSSGDISMIRSIFQRHPGPVPDIGRTDAS